MTSIRVLPLVMGALVSCPVLGQPLLGFPIARQNPYTAPITTVLDHAARTFYEPTGASVQAYTGELAAGTRGSSPPYGYFHVRADNVPRLAFVVNGHYVGTRANGAAVLNYSGHAGYDYRYGPGTEIVAAADGKLYIPAGDSLYGRDRDPWCAGHVFYIDHGEGWTTWYLHADHLVLNGGKLEDGRDPHPCAFGIHTKIKHDEFVGPVVRGEPVAVIGNFAQGHAGGVGYHLHFEVRRDCVTAMSDGPAIHGCRIVDPYGWEWPTPDPFTTNPNGSPYNSVAAGEQRPLWDLPALHTEVPEITGIHITPQPKSYALTIYGKYFEKGALVTLWETRGQYCVGIVTPTQVTNSRIVAIVPRDLPSDRGTIIVKVENLNGPRSRGTQI